MRVAERRRLQYLIREALDLVQRQGPSDVPHVLLEVVLTVLENKIQLVFRINNFFEFDNVRVLQTFEERDFSNCRAWHAIVLFLESNLL